jgi:hypothetical protein
MRIAATATARRVADTATGRRSLGREDGGAGAKPLPGREGAAPAVDWSANARSWADWKRSPGCFSRQRRTIDPTAEGRSGTSRPKSGGSSFKIAFKDSTLEARAKARSPVAIS